jgi:hypothetical protein
LTHILLIDPHKEMILHNLPVYENSDVKKIEKWIKMLEAEHPDIERLILSMGTVRIMEPGEPIPIPLQPGKGLVIPSEGGCTE